MNHLAHALLSGPDHAMRLGGLMGDFVRGAIDPALPHGVREGIALHRAIDSFTDTHAVVCATRILFVPPFRRYAGILIDIWFDHLLARDFGRWSDTPLEPFSNEVMSLLQSNHAALPESLQRFSRYMHARGLPAAYVRRDMISEVLLGVSSRLKRANPLVEGLIEISRLEPELEAAFSEFYPQLTAFAANWRELARARSE